MCDKRNLHRLIALALAAMFTLAGSAATAESSLKGDNAEELERLLAVPAENTLVDFSFKKPPRIPVDALDRYLMWNEIALDTTAIDHTPVDPASGEDPRRFGEQLGPPRSAYAMAIIHIAMFDAENAITKRYVSYSGVPSVSGNVSLDRAIAQAAHDALVNTTVGVLAISSSSGTAPTAVMVRNSVASYNSDTGLSAQTHAILRVAHSVVTGNNTGVSTADGGTLFSYGDNDINGNTTDNTGILTSLAMH